MDVTPPSFPVPADLPIAAKAKDITRAVAEHPVTLVVGATGSGKSTQLAKICLGAGRGAGAMIGHTQPRRIAARSVAARIASELGAGLGRLVGYQVRFRRHTAPDTRGQADDRRDPARRDPGRPQLARLRHPHHRRGARTDAERRLRSRLPARARAPASGPSGGRGLGHPGGGEASCVLRRGAGHRGGGPDPPDRDPVPARRGGRRRPGEGRGGAPGDRRRARRRARVPVRRARDPGDRGPAAAPRVAGHRALPPPCTDVRGAPAGAVRARGRPPRGARDEPSRRPR